VTRYILSEDADRDLDGIWDYIAADNVDAAESAAAPKRESYAERRTKQRSVEGEVMSKENMASLSANYTGEGLRSRFGLEEGVSLRGLESAGIITRTSDGL
jgi:hypothetical protein